MIIHNLLQERKYICQHDVDNEYGADWAKAQQLCTI